MINNAVLATQHAMILRKLEPKLRELAGIIPWSW